MVRGKRQGVVMAGRSGRGQRCERAPEQFPGEGGRVVENQVGRSTVEVRPHTHPEAEEDPQELLHPGGGTQARPQRGLEGTMHALHHSIALWVIR